MCVCVCILKACFIEHDKTLFLFIIFYCGFPSCCVFSPIPGSSWCKNCPIFFSRALSTMLWSSSGVVVCNGCLV